MDNNTRKQIIKFAKPQSCYTVLGIIFIVAGVILLVPIIVLPMTRTALEVNIELDITAFILGLALILRKHILKS